MGKLDLTFDAGAPLDASKLMQLVSYINELDSKTLQLTTDVNTLSSKNVALRLISDTKDVGKVTFTGAPRPVKVDFTNNRTLITAPSAILVTLETSTADADMISYISNPTQTGFTCVLNRVAGVTSKGAVTTASASFDNVKIHYLALAKLDI